MKVHVSDRLSNYAGRSAENDPALLRKRKVSVAEEDFEDTGRDYRYAKPGRPKETKKLKTVESISETAYTSTLLDYMEFCAGRSVAITDIEEQCNWFITRVHQIKESLRKIQLVAIGFYNGKCNDCYGCVVVDFYSHCTSLPHFCHCFTGAA